MYNIYNINNLWVIIVKMDDVHVSAIVKNSLYKDNYAIANLF
jgi:hypothetical protein